MLKYVYRTKNKLQLKLKIDNRSILCGQTVFGNIYLTYIDDSGQIKLSNCDVILKLEFKQK